jgi:predicted nucleic acid-binding protein
VHLACAERARARLVTADRRLLAALAGSELAARAVHLADFAA